VIRSLYGPPSPPWLEIIGGGRPIATMGVFSNEASNLLPLDEKLPALIRSFFRAGFSTVAIDGGRTTAVQEFGSRFAFAYCDRRAVLMT
jgi:hypothetical protein